MNIKRKYVESMGTRAYISIRIKAEDKGKTLSFDKTKLPKNRVVLFEDCIPESVTLTEDYLTIYNHHDGYMDGVGSALVADFNDYDTALNLILMGYVDSVDYKQLVPFGSTTAEAVLPDCEPLPEIKEMCTGHIYKFEDGRWWHATDDWESRNDPSRYKWKPISMSRAKGYEPYVLSDESIAWQQEYYDMAKEKRNKEEYLRKLGIESNN